MATIERSFRQLQEELSRKGVYDDTDAPEGVDVVLDEGPEPDAAVMETEDGGAVVSFGSGSSSTEFSGQHEANLAEDMDETELAGIAQRVIADFERDERSRSDWEKQRVQGLDSLGLKYKEKTKPWVGACSVTHPLLMEAVVRFQAQTIGDIYPAAGPVRTTIVGVDTPDKRKQAQRVEQYMNWVITDQMPEYRPETEKLLFGLAVDGSAFRKIYPSASDTMRPASSYVPAKDLVVDYDAPDLLTAERISHRMKKSDVEVKRLTASGLYRSTDLTSAVVDRNVIEEKIDDLTGFEPVDATDTRRTIIEQHCYWDLEYDGGVPLPYIITVDKTNAKVLAIYRNWDENDPTQKMIQHFVHYQFVVGVGFYGLGLGHLIGPSSKAATSILQQLVDAGEMANIPAGLKTRGLKINGDDEPVAPGEFKDVDVPMGTLRDNIMFMPFKEPSAVLFQLLGAMVEDGRRFASMADLKISDMNQEAPVGTTLAIIERAMKMQSAIEQRIHAGLRQEFKILARVIRDYTEPQYPYEEEGGQDIKGSDFDERIDVIPVADPNASSMAQKIMQYQAAMTAAQQAPPGVFDLAYLNRQFVEIIGMRDADRVVPIKEQTPPKDPISENADIMNGSPVSAAEYQDHDAHMRVHASLKQDPQFNELVQNSQAGNHMMALLDAHIREHAAFQYRRQIEQELGTPLPPLGQPLPPDIEKRLSVLAADAADQLTGKKQAQQQAEQAAAQLQDPIVQTKMREVAVKEQEVQRKTMKDQMDAQARERKMQLDAELEALRMAMQAREGDLDRQQRREKEIIEELSQIADRTQAEVFEGARLGLEAAKAIEQGLSQNRNGEGNG